MPKHSVLTCLAGTATSDVATFAKVLAGLPSGARPVLQYCTVTDRHRKKNAVLHLDHTWLALYAAAADSAASAFLCSQTADM